MKLSPFEKAVIESVRGSSGDETTAAVLISANTDGQLGIATMGLRAHHEILGFLSGAEVMIRNKMNLAIIRQEASMAAAAQEPSDEPPLPGIE